MLKKTITYTDYNGLERTEDFYFNLTEAELQKMDMFREGGLQAYMERALSRQDSQAIGKFVEAFIRASYGEKSPDGRRFVKSEELSTEFEQTEAYSKLWIELGSDENEAFEFVKGVVPDSLADSLARPNLVPINE